MIGPRRSWAAIEALAAPRRCHSSVSLMNACARAARAQQMHVQRQKEKKPNCDIEVRGNTLSGNSSLAFEATKTQRIKHDEWTCREPVVPFAARGSESDALIHTATEQAEGEKRDG
ncbi:MULTISPECIES: hypothetical protein [unclassified Caballeronia]|uniref:hypothetical protein n=1 Tax=unclassified Caballeronia TaxID=2646786 RepID=UPI0011D29D0C|nr:MULTISPECIES: hypothetical protein [unclassified Caballeronia]MCE4541519.1 hypothetical protein [Caballeronia sp. PC1]MCE4569437.1 hypothetical protein [Caballeronia sp. CLC5]